MRPRPLVLLLTLASLAALTVPASAAPDLGHGHWAGAPPSRATPRLGELTVWTGKELVFIGGTTPGHDDSVTSGVAYDPSSRRWRSVPAAPKAAPGALVQGFGQAVWTGSRIVASGYYETRAHGGGIIMRASYDRATNRWTTLRGGPLAQVTSDTLVADAQHEAVFLGARSAAYDPVARTWRRLAQPAGKVQPTSPTTLLVGNRILVAQTFSSYRGTSCTYGETSWWLDPRGRGRWTKGPIQDSTTAEGCTSVEPSRLLLVGGRLLRAGDALCLTPVSECRGTQVLSLIDPVRGTATPVPAPPVLGGSLVSTGGAVVALQSSQFLGFDPAGLTWGPAAVYDVAHHRWTELPTAAAYVHHGEGTLVWTGSRVLLASDRQVATLVP